MSTSEKRTEAKLLIAAFALCLALLLAAGYVGRITRAPEDGLRTYLLGRIAESELLVFDAIERQGVFAIEEVLQFVVSLEEAAALREEAQQLWDSIPVGEVIARRGPGGYRRIGRNEVVGELRARADGIERAVIRKKQEIARSHGHLLANTSEATLWEDNLLMVKELEGLHARNAWYYYSWWGNVVSLIRALARVMLFITFVFCFLLGIPSLGALFELVTEREQG